MLPPANLASDANKITYFTPRFSPGFQFGFSYTPDITDGNRRGGTGGGFLVSDQEDVGHENIIGVGVNFVRTFDDVDFAWAFGYEHGFVEGNGTAIQAVDSTQNCINSNAQTSARLCIDDPDNQQGRDIFTTGFQVGVGGWKVGAAFQYDDEGQERNNEQIEVVAGEIGGADTLGPGVTIGAAVQGWRGWGDDGNENFDGVAFTMGTALSF